MVIQPLTLADQRWVFSKALVETARFDYMRPDPDKIKHSIVDAISSAQNFAIKAVSDGEIVGALGSLTIDNLWAEKKCSIAVFFRSYKAPAGAMLIKAYREWLDSRPVIRVGGFAPSFDMGCRTTLLLEHLGFTNEGGNFLYCKR